MKFDSYLFLFKIELETKGYKTKSVFNLIRFQRSFFSSLLWRRIITETDLLKLIFPGSFWQAYQYIRSLTLDRFVSSPNIFKSSFSCSFTCLSSIRRAFFSFRKLKSITIDFGFKQPSSISLAILLGVPTATDVFPEKICLSVYNFQRTFS